MSECPICAESYTVRLRKAIHCPHCPFVCCMSCVRQFILMSATEPACMSCKVQLSYEFLLENLPGTFWHKDYKGFRKDLLLSREETLIPDTQPCITRIYRKNELWKYMEGYKKRLMKIRTNYSRMCDRFHRMETLLDQERRGLVEIPPDHPLFRCFNEDNSVMVNEDGEIIGSGQDARSATDARPTTASSSFIHACPNSECRGFFRGEQSRCIICNIEICIRCLQIRQTGEDHECRQEDLDTTQLLRQNTKSCPSCSMSIYKISGCDQMWCTQCKTPFSWKTGRIINQTIHNPHYYEWMQRNPGRNVGRELMDIPCGGLPTIEQLHLFPARQRQWAYDLHRNITHVEQVSIPHSQRISEQNQNCKDLRILYLLGNITREDWKSELYRREKTHQKHTQYIQILQTFAAVSSDWLRRMVMELQRENIDISNEIKEMVRFFQYIRQQIQQFNKRYKSSLENIPGTLFNVRVLI